MKFIKISGIIIPDRMESLFRANQVKKRHVEDDAESLENMAFAGWGRYWLDITGADR